MFKRIQLEPENNMFSAIISNGKSYTIPPFQRDYTWEEEHLTELWEDIENMLKKKVQHFMGYIVLESKDNKHFKSNRWTTTADDTHALDHCYTLSA